jgi:hypothetical protein
MKRVIITDLKGRYPKFDKVVENDANAYFLIDDHVVANGGRRYTAGQSMRTYFGRFWVEEHPIAD